MSHATGKDPSPGWFLPLLDTAPEVYFRYALVPSRRFVYLSPSVKALTGHSPDAFYDDPAFCLTIVPRDDRRVLRQVLRARRGLTLPLRILRDGSALRLELRTVAVTHSRQVVAIEGVARLASAAGPSAPLARAEDASPDAPTQQRLAALMYEVHDLLHRVLPPASAVAPSSPRLLRVGELALDLERLSVSEAGAPVTLTSREMLVLRWFLQHPGQVATRQQLLEHVWGYSFTGDDRTVDVHVSRLRKKLPSLRDRLVAIKHVGYRLDADTADDAKIANF